MTTSVLDLCHRPTPVPDDRPGVLAPPPLIYAIGLATGELLDLALPVSIPGGPAITAAAWMAGAIGAVFAASFVIAFARAGTPVDPGRPTSALVTTGPYRVTRNPGYLGMAFAYIAITLATGSVGAAVMLLPTIAVIDCAVIRREERYLATKFGSDYDAYRRRVRRWL